MPKTPIDHETIKQLATIISETGINEIEYETEDLRLKVSKSAPESITVPVTAAPAPVAAAPVAAPTPAAAPAPAAAEPAAEAADTDYSTHPGAVKSPMVGVIYMAAEPGAAPFIKEGDTVKEGQTLLLVEAMKTFNPVPAPRAGKVVKILAIDSQPVEYDEPLVIVE